MAHRADIVVIGGGVIGLACCRALSYIGKSVVLLEKNAVLGFETSRLSKISLIHLKNSSLSPIT